MKPFMDQDFLLHSDVARRLYHKAAETMPILDITVISARRKLQRIVILTTSLLFGLAVIIISGVSCAPVA